MELVYQYLWRHKMFGLSLSLDGGRTASIIDPGRLNTDAGPDFFNAKILIDGEIWAGNVEIHVRASDWFRHGHDSDPAYDSVILHVVGVADREVYRSDGSSIPAAEVTLPKDFYISLAALRHDIKAVKCAPRLPDVPALIVTDWLETLAVERIQAKAQRIMDLHRDTGGDWPQTLFTILGRALGFGLNSEPFEMLARSIPLKFLMRHADAREQLEAILFGQASLLDPAACRYDDYYRLLCREYTFLRSKYDLRPIPAGMWKYARTRPQNLPHRRIALLAASVGDPREGLASAMLAARGDVDKLREIFSWSLSGYWLQHYSFATPPTPAPSSLGKGSIDVLLINVAAPFYYAHAALHNDPEGAESAMRLLYSLPPERNSITTAWREAGIKPRDAQSGQALIHLRKEYCDRNRCFDCRIGHRLLREAAGASSISPFSAARSLKMWLCGAWICLMTLFGSCSSSRKVPQGEFLLDKVSFTFDSTARKGEFDTEQLQTYMRQLPNHKMLWSMKFRLGIYNMQGADSTKWWNRLARNLGEAPVIYDSTLTAAGVTQLRNALINKGHLHADVEAHTTADTAGRKMKVEYSLSPGPLHTVRSISYEFPDSILRSAIMRDSAMFPAKAGMALDRDLLELQREFVTTRLRNAGYYAFAKELITFNADTTSGSLDVDLTMKVNPVPDNSVGIRRMAYSEYLIRSVRVITDYTPAMGDQPQNIAGADTVRYRDLEIFYGHSKYLRPGVIFENCFLRPGEVFRQRDVDRTYQALSRLGILKFTSVRTLPAGSVGDTGLIDAYILLTPGKSQVASVELEGTNSEGDLGVAVGLGYSHRNIGRGSETLSAKFRAAYESLSGDLKGLLNNRYLELSADVGLSFPKFKAPFLRESFKRHINASTDVNVSINYQERPEYTRIITTAGFSYKWMDRRTLNRHTFTPIDINYVYLPASTNDFIDQIAPDNPLLRYSYEDHFIMRLGYSFYYSDKRPDSPWTSELQRDIHTLRVNGETAGNLLFALSSIFDHRSDFHDNPYSIFGIHYSQYVKAEADFSLLHHFDTRNAIAFHAGAGVGVPYGNSTVLPFEKRFYGGGANGVRGWAVRTLGPGAYPGVNSVSDFINQCGDIRLDLSVEYRAKLFWVLELGAFIDVGNIWTIRDYPNQPDGVFRFSQFYKQLAGAYGLGLRLDFNYFLIRFDLGMKAHNPARGEQPWPIIHPRWARDRSLHFSIGYPF